MNNVATSATTIIRQQTTDAGIGFQPESMTRLHWTGAGLAAITGGIHIYLFLLQGFTPFLLAGVVFFAAILGLLVTSPGRLARRSLYAAGIPFTAAQIAIWVMVGMPDFAIGVVDKVVQVMLIAILVYLLVRER